MWVVLPVWLSLVCVSCHLNCGGAGRISRRSLEGAKDIRDFHVSASSHLLSGRERKEGKKRLSSMLIASANAFLFAGALGRPRRSTLAQSPVRASRISLVDDGYLDQQVFTPKRSDDGAVWKDAIALKGELERSREKNGPDHPETLEVSNRYADIVSDLGWHSEAEPIRNEVLIQTRKITIDALNDYASTLGALGRNMEAVPLKQEVLELQKQNHGPDHPETVDALRGYAEALSKVDKKHKAEPLLLSVMNLTRKSFGEDHPSTLRAMTNYADLLLAIGGCNEGKAVRKELLELTRASLGAEDPETLVAMNSYADALLGCAEDLECFTENLEGPCAEDDEEALRLKKDVLDTTRKTLGQEDFGTVKALCRYAVTLARVGRQAEAEPLKKEVLERMQRRFGSENQETVKALNNYAVTLAELGRGEEAEPMMKQVYEFTSELRGPDHPGTLRALDNWVTTLRELGRESEALKIKDYVAFTGKVAIAMFDFDQTLAVHHVFHTLGEYKASVTRKAERAKKMASVGSSQTIGAFSSSLGSNVVIRAIEVEAASPAGQLSRLTKEHEKYNAKWAFGGESRILALRSMLERLERRGVKMMVCTLGYPAVAKKLLEEAGLLRFFGWDSVPSVVGARGASYRPFFSDYDLEAAEEFEVVEDPEEILESSKVDLLSKLLEQEGARERMKLPLTAGVLIEDDKKAIEMAQRYVPESEYERVASKGSLNTVFVELANGMRPDVEMKKLLEIADA